MESDPHPEPHPCFIWEQRRITAIIAWHNPGRADRADGTLYAPLVLAMIDTDDRQRVVMIEQRTIRVHGRVQGVSFRMAARDQARQLGVRGFARNEADGSVAIEAEGEPAALEAFVAWCQQGPPAARVERVEVTSGAPSGHETFRVG